MNNDKIPIFSKKEFNNLEKQTDKCQLIMISQEGCTLQQLNWEKSARTQKERDQFCPLGAEEIKGERLLSLYTWQYYFEWVDERETEGK